MSKIPVEISARHIHLSEEDFKSLFGEDVDLDIDKELSQKGEFASRYRLTIKNEEREIKRVRVLGPFRKQTQVEVTMTDARYLQAEVPLRLSGDLSGSAPVKLISDTGAEVELPEGMIVAKRHLHLSTKQAEELGLQNDMRVSFEVAGERGGRLDNCIVRIKDSYEASFHIDTDEANALGLHSCSQGELIIKK